ncbi:membrane protein [Bacteroidia bacterium]|nr:membrane protein [Bacteroidia bacterium]
MAQTDNSAPPIKDYTPGILHSLAVGVEYRVKAGLLMGGTAPIPVPLEIQQINGYNPLLNIMLEAEVQKSFTNRWALSFGLRMEQKGMKTQAQVKNYAMELRESDGSAIVGVWTGGVETTVNNSYLTLPVLVVWKPAQRWGIKCGGYVSYLLTGTFSGYVQNGYLREGNPTGEKIIIKEESYNFSRNLAKWNYGIQLGTEFQAFTHLFAGLDFTWGINSIFPNDFTVMTFAMHPIYLGLNFGYKF